MKKNFFERAYMPLILSFAVLLVMSCRRGERVDDIISAMKNQKVNLCLQDMSCMRSAALKPNHSISASKYSIIVYVDSSICSPCNINHFFEWNRLMAKTKAKKLSLNYFYIVAPKKTLLKITRSAIESCVLNSSIYIDSAFSFRKSNSFLPLNTKFHVFLVDDKMRIKVVGNPVYNNNIFNLMIKTAQSNINN